MLHCENGFLHTVFVVFVDRLEDILHSPTSNIDAIVLQDLAITPEISEERHGEPKARCWKVSAGLSQA